MAIYSLNLGFVQRSKGESSLAFSAYINGMRLKDERTGKIYDFTKKKDVIHLGIFAPEGAPKWALQSHTLWNRAEAFEDELAQARFRGDSKDETKQEKSLKAREAYINTAQIAQRFMGAVPNEFTKEQAAEVCIAVLKENFVSRGLVVDASIHEERGNRHLHMQISRRALVEGEFSKRKDTWIVSKEAVLILRKSWADHCNKMLERIGSRERISEKSFVDLGIELNPTQNISRFPNVGARIIQENEAIAQENHRLLLEKPEMLVRLVASRKSVFTKEDLKNEILKRVGGDPHLFEAVSERVRGVHIPDELRVSTANDNEPTYEGMNAETAEIYAKRVVSTVDLYVEKILSDEAITVSVGERVDGHQVYGSREYQRREESLLSLSARMAASMNKSLDLKYVHEGIRFVEEEGEKKLRFSEEQKQAVEYVTGGGDLRCLVGRAGTGKTTLMRAVARAYETAGYRVLGAAFQGRVADGMMDEIGVSARTFDSYFWQWKEYEGAQSRLEKGVFERGKSRRYYEAILRNKEQYRLQTKDVIIVDESNMIGAENWEKFLKEAASVGARVIALGDSYQKLSLEEGDTFRLLQDKYGSFSLKEIHRQKESWQREASKHLNDHQIQDGLRAYNDRGRIHWSPSVEDSIAQLARHFVEALPKDKPYSPQSAIALTYTNEDVGRLNKAIFKDSLEKGLIQEPFTIGSKEYAKGAPLLFGKNDNQGTFVKALEDSSSKSSLKKGVRNGSLGVIQDWDEKDKRLTVSLTDGRLVAFNVDEYREFELGYAMTIMKSEGSTFEKTFVLASPQCKASDTLVMMTRHKQDTHLFANHEQFEDFKGLCYRASSQMEKATYQDYTITEESRPYFERIAQYLEMAGELGERNAAQKEIDKEEERGDFRENLTTLYEAHQALARDIVEDWSNHALFARQAGLSRETLEVRAGLRERLMSEAETRALSTVELYVGMVGKTRSLWKEILKDSSSNPTLATQHPLYEHYLSLKQERGSLAMSVMEVKPLSAPYLRLTPTQEKGLFKDYWGETSPLSETVTLKTATRDAKSFQRDEILRLWESRLSPDDLRDVSLLKSYKAARNHAAALHYRFKGYATSALQDSQALESAHKTSLEWRRKRDALALKIIERAEHFEGFYGVVGLNDKDIEKLLDHGLMGEFRERVQDYQSERDPLLKALKAEDILCVLKAPHALWAYPVILKENHISQERLQFDAHFGHALERGEVSPHLRVGDVYPLLESYKKTRQEASALWRIVRGAHEKEREALQTSQIGLLQSLDARFQSFEALKAEYEQKIAAKEIHDSLPVYLSGVLDKAVGSLNPGVIHHNNYHALMSNQSRLREVESSLASKKPFDSVVETGQEAEWQALSAKRTRSALEISKSGVVVDFLKAKNQTLYASLLKDQEKGLSDEALLQFKKSDSFYARCLSASYLAEKTKTEEKKASKTTRSALIRSDVSFEGVHLYAALWEGITKGELPLSEIDAVEKNISRFVAAKKEYSERWASLQADSQGSLEQAIEEKRETLKAFFKESVRAQLIKESSDLRTLSASSIDAKTQSLAFKVEGEFERAFKAFEQKREGLDKEASDYETQRKEALSSFEKETRLSLQRHFKEAPLNLKQTGEILSHLRELQASKQALFEGKIKNYSEELGALKKERDEAAYHLLQTKVIKDYVESSSLFQVKRLAHEFAENHEKRLLGLESPQGEQSSSNNQRGSSSQAKMPSSRLSKQEFEGFIKEIQGSVDLGALAQDILGRQGMPLNKSKSSAKALWFGTKGSLIVNLAGAHQGTWRSFELDKGGRALELVKEFEGGSFKDCLERIRPYVRGAVQTQLEDYLRGHEVKGDFAPSLEFQKQKEEMVKEETQKEAEKLRQVQALYEKTLPLNKTQAEKYIREARGITCDLSQDLRYLPEGTTYRYKDKNYSIKYGALAAIARDRLGEIKAIQVTYLDGKGGRALNEKGEKLAKITYGSPKGAFVHLNETPLDKKQIFIAEGVETALSLKEAAVKGQVLASLGISNLRNWQGTERDEKIILCADNDEHKPNSKTHLLVQTAKEFYEARGLPASIVRPETPGHDFNDVLKREGVQKIKDLLRKLPLIRTNAQDTEIGYNNPYHENSKPDQTPKSTSSGHQRNTPGDNSDSSPRESQLSLAQDSNQSQKDTLSIPKIEKTSSSSKTDPKFLAKVQKAASRLEGLIEEVKVASTDEEKAQAKSALKEKLKLVLRNPHIIDDIRIVNKDLASKLDSYLEGMKQVERQNSKGKGLSI